MENSKIQHIKLHHFADKLGEVLMSNVVDFLFQEILNESWRDSSVLT